MIVCINGKFVNEKEAKISLFDHGFLYRDGVFDTIAAVNGKIFWLEEHIDRTLHGCKRIHLKVPWSKEELIDLTKKTFKKNKQKNGRIRITITRGTNGASIYDTESCKPNLVIFSSELKSLDNKIYENGLKLMATKHQRFYPDVKNLSFLPSIIAYMDAKKEGYDDAIFVNDNQVREGTTFNIFIIKDNKLKTPLRNILKGITAKKVIELASNLGYKTNETDISFDELVSSDECFITGTTKKIVPVVQVDNTTMGDGKPGKITKELMKKFSEVYF